MLPGRLDGGLARQLPLALPAITLSFALPAALVAFRFRHTTSASPPLGPAIMGVGIPLVGLTASLFA